MRDQCGERSASHSLCLMFGMNPPGPVLISHLIFNTDTLCSTINILPGYKGEELFLCVKGKQRWGVEQRRGGLEGNRPRGMQVRISGVCGVKRYETRAARLFRQPAPKNHDQISFSTLYFIISPYYVRYWGAETEDSGILCKKTYQKYYNVKWHQCTLYCSIWCLRFSKKPRKAMIIVFIWHLNCIRHYFTSFYSTCMSEVWLCEISAWFCNFYFFLQVQELRAQIIMSSLYCHSSERICLVLEI